MRGAMLAGALTAALTTLVGVAPAQAATPGISLSRDGVTWAAALTGSLFGDYRLVPGDAVTRTFWVRNDATSAGYLRLTLRDVATTNLDFADALSLRADLVGWPGETVAVQSARPCSRLTEGPIVPAGSAARIELTAALGDLVGLRGQGGTAGFNVVVSLSGEPLGLGKSGCPSTGAEVAGFPGYQQGGTVRSTRGGTVFAATANGWTPMATGPTTVTAVADPQIPTPTGIGADMRLVVANTGRFYQEWFVLLWLVVLLLAAIGSWLLGRRRRET